MAKESLSKSNEKSQPTKPASESPELGHVSEWDESLVKIMPGSLADLPPNLKKQQIMKIQQLGGNLAVQRALQQNVIQRQGGGGGNTTPIPKLGEHAERQAFAIDILKKAYGDRIKSETKVNPVKSEAELRAEYDRSMIAQKKQFRDRDDQGNEVLRDWQYGDTLKHPEMSKEFHGFRDTSNNQIYVDTSKPPDEQVATIAHEMLHASSSGNFLAVLGKPLDEGMTEKLTIDAFAKGGYSVASGVFVQEVALANRMCAAFGADVMTNAYFGGTEPLKDAINEKLGKGSFYKFTQAVKAGDWATVNDMIMRGKIATVEALFSGWVSDEDLDGIEEIYRQSSGEEKAQIGAIIQANIPELWSIGQRTRLRVLLASG